MTSRSHYVQGGLIVAMSACCGALCGGLATLGGTPIAAPFGALFGLLIGVLVSPALIAGLSRASLAEAVPCVVIPPVLVAIASGWASGWPLVSLLAVPTMLASAVAAGLWIRPDPRLCRPPGVCADCGYDRSGLAKCPECGRVADVHERPWTRRGGAAVLIALIGVVAPMLVVSYAVYHRHKPRSLAEWVERMGNNDMQIQWEARNAVARSGGPSAAIAALKHPNPTVRRNAVSVLSGFAVSHAEAFAALREARNDPDPRVRDEAVAALSRIH